MHLPAESPEEESDLESDMYKVVVAEDEYFLLRGISRKISELCKGFTVIGEAPNGSAALELIEKSLPDIVVTDIRMPIMDGLDLIRNVTRYYPNMKIIIISGYSDFEYARQALKLGVVDYLLKPLEDENLIDVFNKMEVVLSSENGHKSAALLNRNLAAPNEYEEIADIVELYLKENFSRDITLESLARQFNFSPGHLCKIFRKYKDDSPQQYLLKLRVNEAKRLLLSNPEANIRVVSSAVGYQDQCYFSRLFKNLTGRNPSEYRAGQ